MRLLSSLMMCAGCGWHVGVPPVSEGWRLEVAAPVAEPDVDDAVRAAMVAALGARGAVGSLPLEVTVTRADFAPAQRGTSQLVYDATLVMTVRDGARSRTVVVTTPVLDPGSAASAQAARPAVFAALAERAAAEAVAWLVDGS